MAAGFQLHHDALTAAAHALPDQVATLDSTHRALTAEAVPTAAFGNVPASTQASVSHARFMDDNARQLTGTSTRLEELTTGMRDTGGALGQAADDQAKTLTQQAEPVTHAPTPIAGMLTGVPPASFSIARGLMGRPRPRRATGKGRNRDDQR